MSVKEHHWLRRRLEQTHKSARGLAAVLNLAETRISEIVRGVRQIQTNELVPMANYLEWDLSQLLNAMGLGNSEEAPGVAGFLKGTVQAGHWMVSAHLPREEWEAIKVPIPPEYQKLDPFWLRVKGESCNEVYPDGTLVLCVSLASLDREPENEEFVIAHRRDTDGQYEVTLKQFRIEGKRKWLVARSTNPEFSGAIELVGRDTKLVQAVAVVVGDFSVRTPIKRKR